MSELVDKLKAARTLLATPARWCQRAAALDPTGSAVPSNSPRGVQWCAIGAYGHVTNGECHPDVLYDALDELDPTGTFSGCISDYNDRCSHADVLALYDKAIQLAEAASHDK